MAVADFMVADFIVVAMVADFIVVADSVSMVAVSMVVADLLVVPFVPVTVKPAEYHVCAIMSPATDFPFMPAAIGVAMAIGPVAEAAEAAAGDAGIGGMAVGTHTVWADLRSRGGSRPWLPWSQPVRSDPLESVRKS
jgi:hypothetical protein